MRVQGAIIKEQGQTFAIVAEAIQGFTPVFGVPVVLMAQDSRGVPTYYGRPDIVRFLASVPFHTIPWKEFTIR